MLDESTWTTLKSISGNETQIIDITTYEVVHFFVSTYDSTPGFLIVTGFAKNAPPGLSDAVQICDSNNNCADLVDIGGNYALPVVQSTPTTSPNIYNITISSGNVNVINSQAIINGTSKFFIKHRSLGKIEFGFTSTLPEYIEINKGTSYSEDGLNLQSQTLYFRTDTPGVIEILVWS